MSLALRLLLAVALTALFSVSVTGYLSHRSAMERVPRAFGLTHGPRGGGGGPMPEASGATTPGALGASRALLAELQGATLRSALIALAVAAALGGWIAVRASRPITRLAEVTRRYGAGERSLRATPQGPSEVVALAHVFNDTADRLQAEEDQRQRFTTDVAHELRTPLTVLKSELEAIQDGLMEADPESLQQLLQQVDVLGRLVNDLRLVTLAEAGALTLHRSPSDVAALVVDAATAFEARAATSGVRVDVHAEPAWSDVDADRLYQVVNALLDNALRHATSRVTVEVAPRAREAIVRVSDDGPGIAEEDRPHVFRRFYRGDPARRSHAGGSGLGLAIVKAIVELHGGRVGVSSAPAGGAGCGACLEVALPLSGSASRPERAQPGFAAARGEL